MGNDVWKTGRRRWLIAGVGSAAVIAVLAFLPPTQRLNLHESEALHQAAHLAAFAVTGFCFCRGTRTRGAHLTVTALLVLLAAGTEVGEHLLFGSDLEYLDVASDLAGTLLGATGAFAVSRQLL